MWIAPGELFEPTMDGLYTIRIDPLALATTSDYRRARLAIPASNRYYVVEVEDGFESGTTSVWSSTQP